jgi:hypothetical protein
MRIRSIAANHAHPCLGMATSAMLAVTLAASNGVHAQERAVADAQPGAAAVVASVQRIDPTSVDLNTATEKGMRYPEDGTGQPVTDTWQSIDTAVDPETSSVIVGAHLPNPEPWDTFDRSVSGAATSSCFGPDALPHAEFAVEGLLRLPFLVRAAAAGTCR